MPAGLEAAETPLPDETPDEIEDGFGAADESSDFEPEPAPEAEPDAQKVPAAEAPSEPGLTEPAGAAVADVTPPASAEDEDGDQDGDQDGDEDAGPLPGVEGMAPPKRDLDQNLRAILQEEVAREMAARATDTGQDTAKDTGQDTGQDIGQDTGQTVIETPPTPAGTETPAEDTSDLELIREPSQPLDDDTLPDFGPAPSPDRVDVFATAPDIAAAAAAADKASRRDLFPDIEEINSTLDSHGLDDEDEDEIEIDERSGFRRAFFAVIAIAALLLAVYLAAPKLAVAVPALEPALTAYVEAINTFRSLFTGLI